MPLQLTRKCKKPKLHEATDAEETEEFTWLADVYAPQFTKRVLGSTAPRGKRVNLTPADKKKVDKASIGLPILRTLKLSTINTRPFILEHTIPLQEFREKYPNHFTNIRVNSAPAIQQRTSLAGTTLNSIAGQIFAPLPNLPGPSQDLQSRQTSNDLACPVIPDSHLNDNKTGFLEKVYTWLDHADIPFAVLTDLGPGPSKVLQNRHTSNGPAYPVILDSRPNNIDPEVLVSVSAWLDHIETPKVADPESRNSVSDIVIDEDAEYWELIERAARQRKSHLRQMPNTMSTENNNTSVRGSNNTRPSGSYPRPGESNTCTATNPIKDQPGKSTRRPKSMPSGSQLPSCWNDDMDKFICHMEAQCEFSTKSIVKALKNRFAALKGHVIQDEAIQRRIETLDNQDNPYFRKGAEMAIVQVEANGYEIPSFDPANYPIINWEIKPDHIVLGTSPGKEIVEPDYEYSLQPRVAGGVDINTIKFGPDTPKKTLPIRNRKEADRRVPNVGTYFNNKGHKGLDNITTDTTILPSRDPMQEPSNDGGLADLTNTMYNARIASNPNHGLNGGILGSKVYSTPSKNSKKAMYDVSNDNIRALNNGSPTPTRGIYRSGRENAMSSSTTGTSILGDGREGFGRENSGGPTILERRRARQANRDASLAHGANSPRTP